ncbi:hypothetical protein [Psychroflexus tropicus]|uniref:hypothetical protein n=1 Tax=Psychroflexus tropicus TaxID=197345 RepID=UPI0003672D5A|nr:hypothetical protein [Psychroflexus tropicus]
MRILSLFSLLIAAVCSSCSHTVSETLIAKNQLGLLNSNTEIEELKSILNSDSIPNLESSTNREKLTEIEVYDKKGNLSLLIEPNYQNDSLITIDEIQILDPKYQTKKGLSVDSNFKVIYENYKIDNIQNSISSVILSLNEIGAYVVIDKKHLPSELRFDSEVKIEANQIPDEAPIRYFWLRFDSLPD